MIFAPGTRLGPYEIGRTSPVPGLGEVYDVRDHEQERDVSLTVLRTDFAADPDRRERFLRAANAAALLEHPHILTVHNVGADAQAVYIISEPIQGRTLREVRAGGPIPPGAGAPFVPQIAEALTAAHEKGVVHGNLTPDHILFTADGVKVVGFGLATATANTEATVAGDLAAFESIAETLTGQPRAKSPLDAARGDPEPVEGSKGPRVEVAASRRWPGVVAAVGVIAFAALIGVWLSGRDDSPASTEPEAVASEPVITERPPSRSTSPDGFDRATPTTEGIKPAPAVDPEPAVPLSRLKPAPTTAATKPAAVVPAGSPPARPKPLPAPSRPKPASRLRPTPTTPPRPAPAALPRAAPEAAPAEPAPARPQRSAPRVIRPLTLSRLVWLDRTGAERGLLGDVADYGNVAFSPDGMRVAVTIRDLAECCANDIWTIEISNGSRIRLTSTPDYKWGVVWSPDGSRVAFASAPAGSWDIYETSSNGTGLVRPLLATAREEVSWDWVSTGYLLYVGDRLGRPQGAHQDLWARRIPGGRPFTYLRSVHRASLPSLSPDGRWIAFNLLSAGAEDSNLYVARFPKYDGRLRVSPAGAQWPRWRGNSIFYVDTEQKLVSVPVSLRGSQMELGPANRIGDLVVKPGTGYAYDVSPDGERILVNTAPEDVDTLSRRGP